MSKRKPSQAGKPKPMSDAHWTAEREGDVDGVLYLGAPVYPTETFTNMDYFAAEAIADKHNAEIDRLRVEVAAMDAADKEIARLKAGGCARGDQRTTQHCAEAAGLAAENKRLREALDAYECWMRDVIESDACWPNGPQGTPTLTPALYERFLLIRPTGKTFGESEPKA